MNEIRRSNERGYADHGWLKSFHTFSFADYFDPKHVQVGPLRVINEDRVQAGSGFGTHAHRDMEIISYVLSGELAHKDSMGNGSTIRPGDVQRMSAGTGVRHSEFNPSSTEPVHFLQIWIQPRAQGIEPSYEEKRFSVQEKRGRLRIIASPDQADGSVLIHQDARVYAGLFDGAESATLSIKPGRTIYVHIARGTVTANGTILNNGDALKLTDTEELVLQHGQQAEFSSSIFEVLNMGLFPDTAPAGLISLKSTFSVKETVDKLVHLIESKGLTVFCRIDHAANAVAAGMQLRPTELLIFGNGKGGTPLMQTTQTIGIDLPLKALAWQDAGGQTWISYNDPAWLTERHGSAAQSVAATTGMRSMLAAVTQGAAMP